MPCACAELIVCLAAFASDEPKKASDEPTAVSARDEKEAKEAKKAEPKEDTNDDLFAVEEDDDDLF